MTSGTVALILGFENLAAHDAYQISDVHTKFVETCQQFWTRVQVYDIDDNILDD